MDAVAELLKRMSINDFDVGSMHWIDVTHINNPHSFYVRPTIYRVYMPVLHSYEDRLLESELQLRKTVIYKSKLLQSYVRGQVIFIQNQDGESLCDLFAPDYGCIERSVPLKRLRRKFRPIDVPPLAIHCQLADCKPHGETWSRKVIECMKFFVGKERAKMVVRGKTPDSLIVELMNSCPDDIATMLALNGYTNLGYGNNVLSRLTSLNTERHYFTFPELSAGTVITVRVQTGDSLKEFYVAQVDDYTRYMIERENFTYFSRKQQELRPEDVKVDLPVAVLMDTYSKYERAIIKEITVPDTKARVQLVDWGKVMEVPIARLKHMSDKFFYSPAMAIYCTAEASQAWDNGLHRFLFPGYEFKITIIQAGNKFETPYVVNISPTIVT